MIHDGQYVVPDVVYHTWEIVINAFSWVMFAGVIAFVAFDEILAPQKGRS